jgi:hypothetical protein
MSVELRAIVMLEEADNPRMPVYPEVLRLRLRLATWAEDETAEGLTVGVIVHSLAQPGLTPAPHQVYTQVDIHEPERIVGSAPPKWSRLPALLQTPRGHTVDARPFQEIPVQLNGTAFLPYVPETRCIGEINPYHSLEEQAYERGSLRGLSRFGAAVYLAHRDGVEWFQLEAVYNAKLVTKVTMLDGVDTLEGKRPRVFWGAQSRFLEAAEEEE